MVDTPEAGGVTGYNNGSLEGRGPEETEAVNATSDNTTEAIRCRGAVGFRLSAPWAASSEFPFSNQGLEIEHFFHVRHQHEFDSTIGLSALFSAVVGNWVGVAVSGRVQPALIEPAAALLSSLRRHQVDEDLTRAHCRQAPVIDELGVGAQWLVVGVARYLKVAFAELFIATDDIRDRRKHSNPFFAQVVST